LSFTLSARTAVDNPPAGGTKNKEQAKKPRKRKNFRPKHNTYSAKDSVKENRKAVVFHVERAHRRG
jgi:hypothetical protein